MQKPVLVQEESGWGVCLVTNPAQAGEEKPKNNPFSPPKSQKSLTSFSPFPVG